MKGNHVLISRITTTKDIEYIDFTNISQQYSDLKIVVSMRSTDSAYYDYPQMYLNNDWDDGLGSYAYKRLYVSTTSVYSSSGTSMASPAIGSVGNGATANTFGSLEYYIFNYSSTTQYKNISCDAVGANNSSSVVLGINASTRQSNQAIYRIVFTAGLGSIKAGSSFSIYGIANAVTTPTSSPKAFGGDIVRTDGTYWYHAFTSSGIFTAQTNLSADVLVVGGGGGGSNSGGIGAGGGGGAIYYNSSVILASNSSNLITVGAGGARDNTSVGDGQSGTQSSFNSIIASVVNKAIGSNNSSGRVGGDGGNSKKVINDLSTNYTGGLGAASSYPRRGGSGAGAGNNGSSTYPAIGGNGLNTWSTWATATGTGDSGYFAGGGAGGYEYNGSMSRTAGGLGGGGLGGAGTSAPNYNATDGIANTGGGGGGCGGQSGVIGGLSGNGGSGIVIIRYPV